VAGRDSKKQTTGMESPSWVGGRKAREGAGEVRILQHFQRKKDRGGTLARLRRSRDLVRPRRGAKKGVSLFRIRRLAEDLSQKEGGEASKRQRWEETDWETLGRKKKTQFTQKL